MIKEVIVVEGKDDVTAVKKAVDAEVISVGGYGINESVLLKIEEAMRRCGIIILTDPDYAGDQIRRIISDRVKGAKHAFITRKDAKYKDDIGVENASKEVILEALKRAKAKEIEVVNRFSASDLINSNLMSHEKSRKLREEVGRILGIGYSNGNSFLSKLNSFNISREEFEKALQIAREVIQIG